jgi:hypothetical protein
MDPISRKPDFKPPTADGAGASGASSIHGKQAFPAEMLQSTGKAQAPAGAAQSSGVLESMRSEIAASIARAPGDRNAALQSVVGKRLEAQYGKAVTPEMTRFVMESVKNDPHFSAIFNRIYSEVASGATS